MTTIHAAEVLKSDEDFRNLERTRLRALIERDFALARSLHAPDFHLVTPRGATHSRASYLEAVESRRIVYLQWKPADIVVRRFGDVALLRYRAEIEMPGATGDVAAFACWHTDSYELRDGVWQVVWSQATRVS